MTDIKALDADDLRWICSPDPLNFDTTAAVEPVAGIVGQPLALQALSFGLDCDAPGQNIFVRGISGTGRMTMVQRLLTDLKPVCRNKLDRCYVHNFLQPDRPRLISLPRGQGRVLRRRLRRLADFVASELVEAMNAKPLQASRVALQERAQQRVKEITDPFEAELETHGLALVQVKTPVGAQAAVFPVFDNKPVPPEQFQALVESGQISDEEQQRIREQQEQFTARLPDLTQEIGRVVRENTRELEALSERQIRSLVDDVTKAIRSEFDQPAVDQFLKEVEDDIVERLTSEAEDPPDPHVRYGINVLLEHRNDDGSPVVVDNSPSLNNLLGTIEAQWESGGQAVSDYRGIRAGSLLEADNGYLILDVRDILSEPGAWKILMRTLRTGMLEIVPAEFNSPFSPAVSLKPEPIPVKLRVVLLGDARLYYQLDQVDNDFSDQFKVLADFDDVIERSDSALWQYAGVLSRIARDEGLRHFTPCGVAALAEHGARVAAQGGKLTTRFGRIADIAREANWVAGKRGDEHVLGEHVVEAVRRTKQRASLPSIRFQNFLKEGTIRVETRGEVVGQVNGLAVMSAGPLTYGFPARITATISAGTAGVIDIEGRSAMSGSIHTKGFQILGGLLRHLLRPEHPLAFSASIAFEQSYGGIDGDSASGAEICCLLSALTDVPLRQDLAMTGAIDQHGAVQAIGGVNEKIEGFYDICEHFQLTGSQGVIIPRSNADDLMLRQDVVAACREGRFQIYAVDRIEQALALFTGVPERRWRDADIEDSLLGRARRRAREFWEETVRGPQVNADPGQAPATDAGDD